MLRLKDVAHAVRYLREVNMWEGTLLVEHRRLSYRSYSCGEALARAGENYLYWYQTGLGVNVLKKEDWDTLENDLGRKLTDNLSASNAFFDLKNTK